MLLNMPRSERRHISLSPSVCTRKHRTRDLTPSNAKCGGVSSGFCLEVRQSRLFPRNRFSDALLADKSMSILLGRPICLRDEDCTVHFPKELDDE